jgi:hypothetical protein
VTAVPDSQRRGERRHGRKRPGSGGAEGSTQHAAALTLPPRNTARIPSRRMESFGTRPTLSQVEARAEGARGSGMDVVGDWPM